MERYISFEGYNTKAFLLDKLDYYKNKGTILEYCCIYHDKDKNINKETGEIDGDKKPHWHLIIDKGNKRLGAEFKENFNEVDPNNTKPLKMRFDKNTKISFHWYGYETHNKKYLELNPPKNPYELRHEYPKEEFICSNDVWLDEMEEELKEYLENPPLSMSQLYFQVIDYINEFDGYFTQKRLNEYVKEKDILDVLHKYKYEIQTQIREHNSDFKEDTSIQQKAEKVAIQTYAKVVKENSLIENLTTNFDKVTIENENETFDVMRVDYKKHKGGN